MSCEDTDTTFKTRITKDEINALPLTRYDGEITLVSDDASAREAAETLGEQRILGFDTETRPTFRKGQDFPAALLQLAGEKQVYLFQLLQIEDLAPVFELLADSDILKVGVAIHDDIKKLQKRIPFEEAGFVELAKITQEANILNTGLRSLSAIFLDARISKTAQISNWSRQRLSPSQITYAATDAWISREIYLKLIELGLTPDPR